MRFIDFFENEEFESRLKGDQSSLINSTIINGWKVSFHHKDLVNSRKTNNLHGLSDNQLNMAFRNAKMKVNEKLIHDISDKYQKNWTRESAGNAFYDILKTAYPQIDSLNLGNEIIRIFYNIVNPYRFSNGRANEDQSVYLSNKYAFENLDEVGQKIRQQISKDFNRSANPDFSKEIKAAIPRIEKATAFLSQIGFRKANKVPIRVNFEKPDKAAGLFVPKLPKKEDHFKQSHIEIWYADGHADLEKTIVHEAFHGLYNSSRLIQDEILKLSREFKSPREYVKKQGEIEYGDPRYGDQISHGQKHIRPAQFIGEEWFTTFAEELYAGNQSIFPPGLVKKVMNLIATATSENLSPEHSKYHGKKALPSRKAVDDLDDDFTLGKNTINKGGGNLAKNRHKSQATRPTDGNPGLWDNKSSNGFNIGQ